MWCAWRSLPPCSYWTDLFPDSPVFCSQGSHGTATALRNNLFSHIGTLSYTEIDTIGTSTPITRMTSDINQVQNGINMTLRLLLRSPFVVFGSTIMAFLP